MKPILPALVLMLAPLHAQADQDQASVLRVMQTWVDTFNKNDAQKLSGFYEEDERVEMLASNGLSLRGHKEIAASYERDMKAVRFYDSESREMKARVFDKTALVSFVHRFKYVIPGQEGHRQVHIRTTTTLRHTKAGWRIVMEHSSAIQGIEREKVING